MTPIPEHLFVSSVDGALYDTRAPNWSRHALRDNFERTHTAIDSTADLRATLRAGPYAWPGGYPMYFVTSDGSALSFNAVRSELRQVLNAISSGANDGWCVVGCQINWEDADLICDHTGQPIPSAYA